MVMMMFMIVAAAGAVRTVIMVVMLVLIFIMIVVVMLMFIFILIMIVVVMMMCGFLLEQRLELIIERILLCHGSDKLCAGELVPFGCDNRCRRIELAQTLDSIMQLRFGQTGSMAENQAACIGNLIVEELAEVLLIHLAFLRIDNSCKAVQLDTFHVEILHSADNIAELADAGDKAIFTPEGMKTMAENVRLFCDKRNYPIYFHCIGGADRTGALAYVLNGVLGVDSEDLKRDWESTFYPEVPDVVENTTGKPFINETYWRSSRHFDDGFARYSRPGDMLRDRVEAYLLACGVTKDEIVHLRALLLEP